ncbi:hypothetical protein [Nocardia sp. NPDC049707]|uniref:hypothetical protein n=1 Tax=Nocardia sp. NPDC049707 TaxID=3154735 RepID=UPI00341C3DA4
MALRGLHDLTRTEGIIPALESAHAVGYVLELDEHGELPRTRSWCSVFPVAATRISPSRRSGWPDNRLADRLPYASMAE